MATKPLASGCCISNCDELELILEWSHMANEHCIRQQGIAPNTHKLVGEEDTISSSLIYRVKVDRAFVIGSNRI